MNPVASGTTEGLVRHGGALRDGHPPQPLINSAPMSTPLPVTDAQRATMRRRRAEELARRAAMRQRAWVAAKACAEHLR